jgi:hypothetical protein
MVRWLFIVIHLMLAGYLAGTGVAAYRMPDAAMDAGVPALFCAFWFVFAAAGFFLRHVWFVTMASIALAGLAGLFLLLFAVDLHARGGGPAQVPWASPAGVFALCGFLLAGQVYAVFSARRLSARQNLDGKRPERPSRGNQRP